MLKEMLEPLSFVQRIYKHPEDQQSFYRKNYLYKGLLIACGINSPAIANSNADIPKTRDATFTNVYPFDSFSYYYFWVWQKNAGTQLSECSICLM